MTTIRLERPLAAGARFGEDIRSSGFTRHLRWTVLESVPPRRWCAEAVMDDGSTVRLLYELTVEAAGTHFVRTLDYRLALPLRRLLNDLLMWRRVRRESNRALDSLVAAFR